MDKECIFFPHTFCQHHVWQFSHQRTRTMGNKTGFDILIIETNALLDKTRLPPGPTRIKSWYHSGFQLILATFNPLIPKLSSDKSESGGKWVLISHWLISNIWRIFSQWENRIYFPPLSDLSEHSFRISGPIIARISWNFEWYQLFSL